MTRLDFFLLCEQYGIAPAIALECEAVREALAGRDDAAVVAAIIDNF
jgi:hypothetical protein